MWPCTFLVKFCFLIKWTNDGSVALNKDEILWWFIFYLSKTLLPDINEKPSAVSGTQLMPYQKNISQTGLARHVCCQTHFQCSFRTARRITRHQRCVRYRWCSYENFLKNQRWPVQCWRQLDNANSNHDFEKFTDTFEWTLFERKTIVWTYQTPAIL